MSSNTTATSIVILEGARNPQLSNAGAAAGDNALAPPSAATDGISVQSATQCWVSVVCRTTAATANAVLYGYKAALDTGSTNTGWSKIAGAEYAVTDALTTYRVGVAGWERIALEIKDTSSGDVGAMLGPCTGE